MRTPVACLGEVIADQLRPPDDGANAEGQEDEDGRALALAAPPPSASHYSCLRASAKVPMKTLGGPFEFVPST